MTIYNVKLNTTVKTTQHSEDNEDSEVGESSTKVCNQRLEVKKYSSQEHTTSFIKLAMLKKS